MESSKRQIFKLKMRLWISPTFMRILRAQAVIGIFWFYSLMCCIIQRFWILLALLKEGSSRYCLRSRQQIIISSIIKNWNLWKKQNLRRSPNMVNNSFFCYVFSSNNQAPVKTSLNIDPHNRLIARMEDSTLRVSDLDTNNELLNQTSSRGFGTTSIHHMNLNN